MKLLHLKNTPIFKQLQLEEALLRIDTENTCIINEGSPPAIVMGISGDLEKLVEIEKLKQTPIPIIRRYSGGGTVVVDENTLFVSFICNKSLVDFEPYPEPLMRWSAALYEKTLSPELGFSLKENDYVIGHRKIGGNAQYLTKSRFVHHTTFLWDYEQTLMSLLKHPSKTPSYREDRKHTEFVGRLSDHLSTKEHFVTSLKQVLKETFDYKEVEWSHFVHTADQEYRKNTEHLDLSYRK